MNELVFPISMTALVYLVAIPLLTLPSLAYLTWQRRSNRHPHEAGHFSTLLAICAPVLVPTLGVAGAAAHRFDGHHAYQVCIALEEMSHDCAEAIFLAALLLLPFVVGTARHFRLAGRRGQRIEPVEGLGIEVRCVDESTLCTRGVFSPWIEVGRSLLDELTEDQLRAALLHEKAHAQSLDPLFGLAGRVFLTINPAGFLLKKWLDRWRLGREIRCDLRALELGGDRFSLAESLIKVARSSVQLPANAMGLTGAAASIRLRVAVLLGREVPSVAGDRLLLLTTALVCIGLVIVFAGCEMRFLDVFHHQSEHLFKAFL